MATLGKWVNTSKNLILPPATWAAPSGMFPTQSRNDSSAYAFNDTTATLTLPATDLADGYLIVAAYEFEQDQDARFSGEGRIIQASGTGTFRSNPTGGYARDASEDRAYIRCWAFVDNPSASATFQFQWQYDNYQGQLPNAGVVRSEFEVIPFFYSDIGIYSSSSTLIYSGTTPLQVTGWSGTDGTNITLTSNVVTVAGDNKRYLILGSQYYEGRSGRTQRWGGLEIDGVQENAAKAYWYSRDSNSDQMGGMYTWLIETSTADVTIETFCYEGDGLLAGEGGSASTGANPTAGDHSLVVIELNDGAEVFQSIDETGLQTLRTAGPVDLNLFRTTDINFSDAVSWVRASNTGMEAQKAMDALVGTNISGASFAVTDATRWTGTSELTVNGVEDTTTFHGNYLRNLELTLGWASNNLSFLALTATQDVGASVTELAGTEGGGNAQSPAGWSGIWGINLDTLPQQAVTVNVTGVSSTTAVGSVTTTRTTAVSVTGIVTTSAVGQVDIQIDTGISIPVTGIEIPTVLSSVVIQSSVNLFPTGIASTAQPGTATVLLGVEARVTGLAITSGLGSVMVWSVIDDMQDPGWTAISDG
ncbi:MAG: hypothetical protein V6Z86_05785 [Hyphomicrobiales bacterium]